MEKDEWKNLGLANVDDKLSKTTNNSHKTTEPANENSPSK